jgi:hypothetical protein
MLTQEGHIGGGYSSAGPNYHCPGCRKEFTKLSSLMQHSQQKPQCAVQGQPNLQLGPSQPGPQTVKFYHGTTLPSALQIAQNGFIPSESGCLGPGVYVARQDKAERFARLRAEETGQDGGLIELLVTYYNPKFVLYNDYSWREEGYDACRSERTSASTNIEWCIRSPSQIRILNVTRVIF